jgi:hypothetical protein
VGAPTVTCPPYEGVRPGPREQSPPEAPIFWTGLRLLGAVLLSAVVGVILGMTFGLILFGES